jgi:hypothetical protein
VRRACIALVIVACDPELYTEDRELRFVAVDLQSRSPVFSGDRALEGSRICMQLDAYRTGKPVREGEAPDYADADDDDLSACYDERIVGPGTIDADRCIQLDAPGTVSWELSRRACTSDLPSDDDRLVFDVMATADVVGAFREAVPFTDVSLEELIDGGIDLRRRPRRRRLRLHESLAA